MVTQSFPSAIVDAMSWNEYFEKNNGRSVRPLYIEGLEQTKSSVASRVAVDFGCGQGIETRDLLSRGWNVIAIDQDPAAISATLALAELELHSNLVTICRAFEEIKTLPACDFLFAYHSLPFCRAQILDDVWHVISSSLNPGGIFAGSFFGQHDEWVQNGRATGTTVEQLATYFIDYEVIQQNEVDRVGPTSLQGPK
ncbi:MAG: methyltransferase domain-containing protein, partial [Proteobacteria bacterium]